MSIIPSRYSPENIRLALEQPQIIKGEIRNICNGFNKKIRNLQHENRGVNIIDENWDNLLILDACRYDMFAEQSNIPGNLESRQSKGSDSWEFISENFIGKELHDTVYITANPHAYGIPDKTFYYKEILLDDCWDETYQTVLPETVASKALDAQKRFPNKRIIVHFMQPHFPFIGKTGDKIEQTGLTLNIDGADDDQQHVWQKLTYGLADEERVLRAYRENLDVALGIVQDMIDELTGRTVITADHGNLVGERVGPLPTKGYGHPRGLQVDGLTKVPWHVISANKRPQIIEEDPLGSKRLDDNVVKDRLSSLGYL